MIGWLKGTVLETEPGAVLLDVSGVGYRLFVPSSTLESIGAVGDQLALYVHTHVREDAIQLYGFASRSELRLFETVVAVGGIGPKLALVILSHLSPEAFARAVFTGDSSALTKIPGIGKKTAARILLELKDKLSESWTEGGGESASPADSGLPSDDAVAALLALGYTQTEAETAVAEVAATVEANDVSQVITAALRRLDRTV